MKTKAKYVSIWDDVDECRTNCLIDLTVDPPIVSDVETVEGSEGWSSLTREFVELENGDEINTFSLDGEYQVEDGYQINDDEGEAAYREHTNPYKL